MASITNIAPQHESAAAAGRLDPDLWDAFWTLYPRHEAKKAARRAWDRLSEADRLAAVVAIADWRYVWRAQGRDASVIPHPATWLNGERWEDEIPRGMIPKATTGLEAPGSVKQQEQPAERKPIPAHILAQLARIKEGR